MKIVAFNGSPRKKGNTEFLLNKVLEPLKEEEFDTELLHIGNKYIQGCIACFGCIKNKNGLCSVTNDIFNDCMKKMLEADAIIIGSPVYFANMTAQVKALIDRAGFVAYNNGGLFENKVGAAIAAQRRGGGVNVVESIYRMFLMSKMIIPGSTYWNFGNGLLKGEVENDKEGIDNMIDLGKRIAWLLKRI
ncbi:MAG: flavodoxin family protein, partial [Deferribacterota bacterium]|nr:flavodoxin family protein [Deferribacterota bacterium]